MHVTNQSLLSNVDILCLRVTVRIREQWFNELSDTLQNLQITQDILSAISNILKTPTLEPKSYFRTTRGILLQHNTNPSHMQVRMAGLQTIFGLLWLVEAQQATTLIATCSRIKHTGIFTRVWTRDLLLFLAEKGIVNMGVSGISIIKKAKRNIYMELLQKKALPEKVTIKYKTATYASHPGGELLADFLKNLGMTVSTTSYDS